MILNELDARIKIAEAKTAEDPSNFDSFPGAENDQKVDSELKKPDPEVKDEGPASRTETTGAEPGSDAKVQQDNKYEADEPVLAPEKKPAESADAEAKEASADVKKVASDILGIIRGSLDKKAKCDPPKANPANPAKPAKTEKKAKAQTMSLEDKILDKIASVRMSKQAAASEYDRGVSDAISLIKSAEEYNRGAADAEALIYKLAQALEETANSADAAEEGAAAGETPEEAGAADAEAAIADAAQAAQEAPAGDQGAAGAGEDLGGDVTPEEVAEAVQELVQEGQISDEEAATIAAQLEGGDAGGEGPVDEEQLAEGIAQAIESGEITEDEAQQLVQELVGAGADESLQDEVAGAGEDAGAAALPEGGAAEAPAAGSADAEAAAADEAAGAADAEAALADAQKTAEQLQKRAAAESIYGKVMQKRAEAEQIARYQRGFIQKCAEYGADPQAVAKYIQARVNGAL